MSSLMMISCWSKQIGVLLSIFNVWPFKLMFYYIEVHFLDHYIQWIKMHGKTVQFSSVFTATRNLSLSWAKSILSKRLSYFLKIHFNIVLLSTARILKYCLSPILSHQIPATYSASSPLGPACHSIPFFWM
jgi:hypothetical protein